MTNPLSLLNTNTHTHAHTHTRTHAHTHTLSLPSTNHLFLNFVLAWWNMCSSSVKVSQRSCSSKDQKKLIWDTWPCVLRQVISDHQRGIRSHTSVSNNVNIIISLPPPKIFGATFVSNRFRNISIWMENISIWIRNISIWIGNGYPIIGNIS